MGSSQRKPKRLTSKHDSSDWAASRNANQDNDGNIAYACQIGKIKKLKKRRKMQNIGEDAEMETNLCAAGGNVQTGEATLGSHLAWP